MGDEHAEATTAGPHGLRGWFGKIRRRRWVALFVFEFFVVLLGVLAAQGLQSWFQARQEKRTAAGAKAGLDRNLRSIILSAEIRRRGLICYGDRLSRLAQVIRDGSKLERGLQAPEEALVIDLGWTGDVPALMSEHYGAKLADKYVNVALWVESFRRAQEREQESWSDLARLSARLGTVTEADRSAAKGALIDATRDLQQVAWATGHLAGHAKDLRIEPDLAELAGARSAPDSCQRAIGYSLEEHQSARLKGQLVTGEPLTRG